MRCCRPGLIVSVRQLHGKVQGKVKAWKLLPVCVCGAGQTHNSHMRTVWWCAGSQDRLGWTSSINDCTGKSCWETHPWPYCTASGGSSSLCWGRAKNCYLYDVLHVIMTGLCFIKTELLAFGMERWGCLLSWQHWDQAHSVPLHCCGVQGGSKTEARAAGHSPSDTGQPGGVAESPQPLGVTDRAHV